MSVSAEPAVALGVDASEPIERLLRTTRTGLSSREA
jgi:hypothetical protein